MKVKIIAVFLIGVFSIANAQAEGLPSGFNKRDLAKLARVGITDLPLTSVCAKVSFFQNGEGLFKGEISHHINKADARATGPTYICGTDCADQSPVPLFYIDGTLAAKLGYYGVWSRSHGGNGKARFYCGAGGQKACSVKAIGATAAQKNKKYGLPGYAFLQVSAAKKGPNTECKIVDPDSRNGGV